MEYDGIVNVWLQPVVDPMGFQRSGFSMSTMLPRSTATGSLLASSLRTVRWSISRVDTIWAWEKNLQITCQEQKASVLIFLISDIFDFIIFYCACTALLPIRAALRFEADFFAGSDLVLHHICSVGQEDRLSSASACDTLGFTTSGTTNYFLIGSCPPQIFFKERLL